MCERLKRAKIDPGYGPDIKIVPRYNVAPMQFIEILARTNRGRLALIPMRWGLYGRANNINARAETLTERHAFRGLLDQRRCVLPVDGFYEWSKASKQPYLISMQDDAPFALAGLWHADAVTDVHMFTIITTIANSIVAPLHNRMPAILEADGVNLWLSNVQFSAVQSLPKPYPPERMKALAVSPKVNDVENEGPECAEPITPIRAGS